MLAQLTAIVRAAGQRSLRYFAQAERPAVSFKTPRDLVTSADVEIEDFLQQELASAFPGVAFGGEEHGLADPAAADVFIADPIDGTTNFYHGYPFYSVSLAFRSRGVTRCGVVYCPPLEQVFTAALGQGAQLNGQPLHVSATAQLAQALAVTGFACVRSGLARDSVPIFNRLIYRVRDVHRDGSAALDLCYLAAGKYDVFWEYHLGPWDTAAGALVLTEAGGRLSDFSGDADYEARREVAASNGHLHAELLAEIRAALSPPAGAAAPGARR